MFFIGVGMSSGIKFIAYQYVKGHHLVLLVTVMTLLAGAKAHAAAPGPKAALEYPMQLAVAALENRFVATGVILDSRRLSTGMHVFRMKIEMVGQVKGFADLGTPYQGQEKEFFSELGAPPALAVGKRVSVILRVTGDEWHQELFLVEVMDNGPRN